MTVSFHKGTENETGGINVVLSPEDGRLFYKLFLPLLVYVDETYKMHKDLPRMAWRVGYERSQGDCESIVG